MRRKLGSCESNQQTPTILLPLSPTGWPAKRKTRQKIWIDYTFMQKLQNIIRGSSSSCSEMHFYSPCLQQCKQRQRICQQFRGSSLEAGDSLLKKMPLLHSVHLGRVSWSGSYWTTLCRNVVCLKSQKHGLINSLDNSLHFKTYLWIKLVYFLSKYGFY